MTSMTKLSKTQLAARRLARVCPQVNANDIALLLNAHMRAIRGIRTEYFSGGGLYVALPASTSSNRNQLFAELQVNNIYVSRRHELRGEQREIDRVTFYGRGRYVNESEDFPGAYCFLSPPELGWTEMESDQAHSAKEQDTLAIYSELLAEFLPTGFRAMNGKFHIVIYRQ